MLFCTIQLYYKIAFQQTEKDMQEEIICCQDKIIQFTFTKRVLITNSFKGEPKEVLRNRFPSAANKKS